MAGNPLFSKSRAATQPGGAEPWMPLQTGLAAVIVRDTTEPVTAASPQHSRAGEMPLDDSAVQAFVRQAVGTRTASTALEQAWRSQMEGLKDFDSMATSGPEVAAATKSKLILALRLVRAAQKALAGGAYELCEPPSPPPDVERPGEVARGEPPGDVVASNEPSEEKAPVGEQPSGQCDAAQGLAVLCALRAHSLAINDKQLGELCAAAELDSVVPDAALDTPGSGDAGSCQLQIKAVQHAPDGNLAQERLDDKSALPALESPKVHWNVQGMATKQRPLRRLSPSRWGQCFTGGMRG